MIIGPGITIGGGVYVDSNAPSSGIVTGNLLFNLDMQNYVSGTVWPDSSGNGNNFQFFNMPTGDAYGTVYNLGTNTAYWYSPGNNGAIAAGDIFPADTEYSKGIVAWSQDGTFNNLIGSIDQETLWGGGGQQYLYAGSNGSNYFEVTSNPNTFPYQQWVYISMSYNRTTGWKLYFNGTEVGSIASASPRYYASTPQIFSYAGNGNNSYGKVAAAHLYTRELTPAEHLQNSNYYATRYSGSNPT